MASPDNRALLHSRYNPEGEAVRFVEALNLNKEIRYFILIEPGLNYIVPPLRRKNPEARIISLHAAESECRSKETPPENLPDASWHKGSSLPLQNFLEEEIPDIEAGLVKIIEWRPGMTVYGGAYLELLSEAAVFIKRADANARTTNAFGRRWFRNFFRNLSIINECIYPVKSELPVVVAGAGPSLENIIPVLRDENKKDNLFVLAVSSAVAALNAAGVEPGLVISTDGGGWALLHLIEYYRPRIQKHKPKKRFLAAAMNAALPSQAGQNPVMVISDGSHWQNLILKGLGIPFVSLPQRGTVSAAAIDLALCLSKGKIFICGVDLSNKDLLTHARPYSFDRLWEEKQNRLNPYYSQVFCRSFTMREGGSHNIYASWFSRQIENYPKRLYSLGNNNSVFDNLTVPVSPMTFNTKNKNARLEFKNLKLNHNKNRGASGAGLLITAMNDPQEAVKLAKELTPLLYPAGKSVSGNQVSLAELKNEILSLTEPYRRQTRE